MDYIRNLDGREIKAEIFALFFSLFFQKLEIDRFCTKKRKLFFPTDLRDNIFEIFKLAYLIGN